MGKLFLYGHGNKSTKAVTRAKLTATCPVGLTVHARSTQSLLTFKVVADETGKAVFDKLTAGAWDVTVSGVDNPPTERVVIDDLDCNVKFPYMTIFVTYPRGSTCTCTKGDVVLTAPDRTGSCSFDVYELGDWTVSSTNGVESDAKVVSVTSFDEFENIKLLHDLYIIDNTGQRQVLDPVEFWGNDDENVKMTVNDDGSVSFEFLTDHSDTVVSNMALDLTSYAYVDVTSVCDRESVIKMRLLHPTSSANMSGTWTIDTDTASHSMECKISTHVGNRLLSIGSYGNASTTLTIRSLSLTDPMRTTINVTYPVDLTCICSNGDTILTAPDTSGSYSFDIYEPGDWTISCKDRLNTVSEVVSVSELVPALDVDLNDAFTKHNIELFISNRSKLSYVCLPSELTSIGTYAFYNCSNLALTSLPDSITSIADSAFRGCTKLALTSLPDSITSIADSAFYNCTKLALTSLPGSITSIGEWAFYECTNLALTSLPDSITSIADSAFRGCTKLALTSLPGSITSIGSYAFYGCTNLTMLTFKGTPNSISKYTFSSCTNLKTINVPWAEGVVANAPWGATKATINYNYKGA